MLNRSSKPSASSTGFSLVEVLVSLVVFTQVILVSLMVFDFNARVSRVQTSLSELQQSLRAGQQQIVHLARLAGRAGVPVTGPTGPAVAPEYPAFRLAVDVANNVAGDDALIAPNYPDSPRAVEGTDILTLRGNFSSQPVQARLDSLDGSRLDATEGTLIVQRSTAFVADQDLSALIAANENGTVPEALVLLSSAPGESFAIVELLPSPGNNGTDTVELDFRIRASGNEVTEAYRSLWTNDENAAFPLGVNTECYVALLEEVRFYIRNEGGAAAQSFRPRLSRARLLPGTGLPYGDGATPADDFVLKTDLAEGIADLQVALGFDSSYGGSIGRGDTGAIFESPDGVDDDWLFNSVADVATAAPFKVPDPDLLPRLYFLRISTLGRAMTADRQTNEPLFAELEDHVYPTSSGPLNSDWGRKYRRRYLQTVVDLRNL